MHSLLAGDLKVAVVGLGYVGLPLAVAIGRKNLTFGFDLNSEKISSYLNYVDPTGEVSADHLREASLLKPTTDPTKLAQADVIVVAVPTPVDEARRPDFAPLLSACEVIGPQMKQGCIVAFESTVYPGATEEVCVPALERASGKQWKKDFFVGYSPERINPGDKAHTLQSIVKVVAGDTPETLETLASLYGSVVTAGVHRAANIRVAEAAKVIENTQRDLNIALMNELSIIFHRMGIDTLEVLEAAGTKWNFLPFRPGLVGGHCIGIDPYYLTHQAEKYGHHAEVVLAGRRINDSMGAYIAQEVVKELAAAGRLHKGARVNVLGFTFKENCPDTRNTKVIDLVMELRRFGLEVAIHDPIANEHEARAHYEVDLVGRDRLPLAEALILAVPHRTFLQENVSELTSSLSPGGLIVDVKSVLDRQAVKQAGYLLWRL